MDIHEYQAKEVLSNFGVAIPQGALAYWVGGTSYGPVHEGLVGYAMNVYQGAHPNTEVSDYLDTIKNGANHEDRIDLVDDVLWGSVDICLTQSHFWDGDKGPIHALERDLGTWLPR